MKTASSSLVDAAAILAIAALCYFGKMPAGEAGALILAVCAGRLYPRPLPATSPPSGGGSSSGAGSGRGSQHDLPPPSGLLTVGLALLGLAAAVATLGRRA